MYFIKNRVETFFAILGIGMFIYFGFTLGHKAFHLKYYGVETQGAIDSVFYDNEMHKVVSYSYIVNGVRYSSVKFYDARVKPKENQRFKVIYSSKDPHICEIKLRGK